MTLLNWETLLQRARNHSHAALLLSNGYADSQGRFDLLYGEGLKTAINDMDSLQQCEGLAFGHIGYHLKNKTYRHLHPAESANAMWPEFFFFEPLNYALHFRDGRQETNMGTLLQGDFPQNDFRAEITQWQQSESSDSYLQKVREIQECIRNGVFYEMNFCQSYEAECELDPYRLFWELNRMAPSPFAAFYKLNDRYLIGSSPERFLQKQGQRLFSQPIKGTAKRSGGADAVEIQALKTSEKDRAENIMIVDLVRNDLSRVCEVGTVVVNELCGIYSYPNVHQMISSVSGELRPDTQFSDITEALFPMGSMTGAPKIEVMKHIDRLENFERGLYSGSVGYWYKGDFDLNVVIRSLEYTSGYLRYAVGGAITIDSDPQEELEECLTKASSIRRLFNPNN